MKLRTVLSLLAPMFWVACDAGPAHQPAHEPAPDTASHAVEDAPPHLPAMAVTIDDLPWIGAVRPGETQGDALQRLVHALVARNVPAMAFPNCQRLGVGAPSVRRWLDAGMEVGNHTAAHLDLNRAPLQQWLRDVSSCHDMIRDLSGADTVWFRFPFLHQGPTAERQDAALALLHELNSPIAHVTIDTSDWILAVAYGEAVRAGRTARADSIGDAFIDHVLRATEHYQDVARRKLDRDVPHVLLLHANLLVADHLGTLLDSLSQRGFAFVSVADAHQDPAYHLPDDYTGSDGLSWLYRMRPATPDNKAWDDAEAARLRARWR